MRPKRTRPRSLAILLAAAAISLGLAAGATAAIFVYGNGFSTKAQFKEIKRSSGGKRCDKDYRDKSTSMKISLAGKRLCAYSTPLVGDAPQPNHVIWAKGQVLPKKTPDALRKAAYLALRVRAGRGDYYELQVRPRGHHWKLLRSPNEGKVADAGRSDAIRPLKAPNKLQLQVRGARVTAFANGKKLISVVDPNPNEVQGRKVAFGLGSRKDSRRETVGVFERIKAGIAD
jgi:hypothetical protein